MAKISKGFSTCVAVFGVLSLIFGLCLSICSWLLLSKFSDVKIYSNIKKDQQIELNASHREFTSYWWGGLVYCVPAILGIVSGCTRNVVAMVFYMVFNIICLICSGIACVFIAIMFFFWVVISELLANKDCYNTSLITSLFGTKTCYCMDSSGDGFAIVNANCTDLEVTRVYLLLIFGSAAVSTFLALIASYVSCCSLCNQEEENNVTYVMQPNQPQTTFNMVQSNQTTQQYMQPAMPPMQSPQYTPQPHMHDKANLIHNEILPEVN